MTPLNIEETKELIQALISRAERGVYHECIWQGYPSEKYSCKTCKGFDDKTPKEKPCLNVLIYIPDTEIVKLKPGKVTG
jgi:hypothetical protein